MKSITLKSAVAVVLCACAVAWAQQSSLPTMRITTQNNQEVKPTCSGMEMNGMCMGTQTMNYVKIARFQLEGAGSYNLDLTPEPQGESDSIRVRGNSTAGIADKRPYRIKFDKEQALFGKPKANSWVLLANYYDASMAMNAIAFRLGQKLGLPFTPTSQFVNLYLNGSYKGIYQLTEQIQVKKSRVDVDKEYGFLVEFDYHDKASDEVKFTAAQYSLGTFIKSPEIEGCDAKPPQNCNDNNTRVKWVKDTVNALMNKMAESGFPANGYRDKIDLESFAKYVLIEQLMDNFDFNSKVQNGALPGSNFAYKDVGQKIKAGPLWDFDLSAVPASQGGIFGGGGFGTRYSNPQEPIEPKHAFYKRLWSDPEFIGYFKAAWTAHTSDFNAIPAFIDSIATALRGSVDGNKSANPSDMMMGGAITLNTSTYNTEITKLKQWWTSRVSFFGTEVGKLTGTTPNTGFTLAVGRNPSAGGNVSVTVGSGAAQTNPSGQLSANANTSITITATSNSGYTFENWTAVSGALPSGITETSATITFSISSNVNIRANFKQDNVGPQPTNYTLQVSKSSQSSSVTVTVGSGTPQTDPTNSLSIPSGTSVTVTATAGSGRTFQNWTAVSGSLPEGLNETSASNTFTMSGNVNIRANFLTGGSTTNYTLTVNGNTAQGSVSVNGQSYTFGQERPIASGESVTLTAAANSGYMFLNWSAGETALPSGINQGNASNASVTFSMSANVNITANFRDNSGGAKTDTLATIEAEDMASSNPQAAACPANPPSNQSMCIGTNTSTGVTNIGYISSGNTATYNVSMAADGSYKLVFRIASNGQASFRVSVNGTSMGTISGNTNDWDGYTNVALDQDVYLNAGSNTIRLEFQSSVNVDYFVVIGEASTAVSYSAPRTVKTRTAVTLKASPKGFSAILPANHGYTSYRLLDMRGREIRRGKVGANAADLRFDGLKRGVLFLRLEGKNTSAVVRAVTY